MEIKTTTNFKENKFRVEAGDKFVEGDLIIPFGSKSYFEELQKNYDLEIKGQSQMTGKKAISRKNDIKLNVAKKMINSWSKDAKINEETVYKDTDLVVMDNSQLKSLIYEFAEGILKANGFIKADYDYKTEIEKLFLDAEVDANDHRQEIDDIVAILEAGRDAKN
ncbi:hypothetical protein [Orenia marismortui]|uniref:Uncharacterized protein n=1 Tax=Orenia marismortui TaxID=46469 RepID=A0A4R8GFG7_9FIRM|nr:hypothetical protein [Orenia marismortui]TDX44326.1 hypothetical protein C7959_15713 [Orenia marismortui]